MELMKLIRMEKSLSVDERGLVFFTRHTPRHQKLGS